MNSNVRVTFVDGWDRSHEPPAKLRPSVNTIIDQGDGTSRIEGEYLTFCDVPNDDLWMHIHLGTLCNQVFVFPSHWPHMSTVPTLWQRACRWLDGIFP